MTETSLQKVRRRSKLEAARRLLLEVVEGLGRLDQGWPHRGDPLRHQKLLAMGLGEALERLGEALDSPLCRPADPEPAAPVAGDDKEA